MQAPILEGAVLHILDPNPSTKQCETIDFIRAMGGQLVVEIKDATHALLIDEPEFLLPELESAIVTAQSCSIPILLARPWLARCEETAASGRHWCEVQVKEFVPSIVQRFNDSCTKLSSPGSVRRDHRLSLNKSISQTFNFLKNEDPSLLERNALKRALELSMLDFAIVVSSDSVANTVNQAQQQQSTETPHQVLGLDPNATPIQIKSAYKKLALLTHPDKGGSEEAFQKVAFAYRSLLASLPSIVVTDKIHKPKHLKSTAHWDNELADHRRLVEELFASHGANLAETAAAQQKVLEHGLKLEAKSAGSTNLNEKEELIHNSCFYLSLAASYLSGIGALMLDDDTNSIIFDNQQLKDICTTSDFGEEDRYLIGETALQLKRRIEAAVVTAHPEWAESGMVGEEVQAFSDFLVYLLDSPQAIISEWAVVVFDTTSGMVDVYKGKYYDEKPQGHASNCLTIQYMPGHYEPLLPMSPEQRPSLSQILQVLDANGVLYVVTDGAA